MTRTSWRDDYSRIVKGRAVAYAESDGRYHADMPFENIHGNGGLLTTVGDLLRWNENFVAPKVGDAAFVELMQTPGRLSGGEAFDYAYGLGIGEYKGLREVRHSGTTASYRAFLARFPDQHVSVAVLCNAGDSTPRQTLHQVADLYLGDAIKCGAGAGIGARRGRRPRRARGDVPEHRAGRRTQHRACRGHDPFRGRGATHRADVAALHGWRWHT